MYKKTSFIVTILIILLIFFIFLLEINKKKELKEFSVTQNVSNHSYHTPFGIKSNCDQILKREAFEVCYKYGTKSPEWVSYTITKASVSKVLKRKNRFYEDKEIEEKYRAKLSDYKKSGYDRGHMMPNATADYSKQSQKESFLLSNITPQHPALNRRGWAYLEKNVRSLATKYNKVHVVTGALYDDKKEYIGNNIEIPDFLYKIIFIPKINKMTAYLMPNSKVKKTEVSQYLKSVDEIETLTGIDFFYDLDDKKEEFLEKRMFSMEF